MKYMFAFTGDSCVAGDLGHPGDHVLPKRNSF